MAFLFITIDPSLVDFNIRPAKREAKFRNLPQIHNSAVVAIKNFLSAYKPLTHSPNPLREKESDSIFKAQNTSSSRTDSWQQLHQNKADERPRGQWIDSIDVVREEMQSFNAAQPEDRIIYLGQAMRLFLLVEKDEKIIVIDQHAAHERIIYNELVLKDNEPQPLLIPRLGCRRRQY